MGPPPSGKQFEIRHDDQRATVVEVGGGIRKYTEGDRPVLDPYATDRGTRQRSGGRLGLGTEPMTCPPNAFQTGSCLTRLEPGPMLTTTWGVRLNRR
jgi:aldose 1-epimerase